MLIQSHLVLSAKLYRRSKEGSRFSAFNKWALCWGSIRPDVHSPFNRGSHKYQISLKLVEDKWNSLEDLSPFRRLVYSYRFGVILHYLADFFCQAHNDDYYDTHLKDHLAYERALHQYITACEEWECRGGSPLDLRLYLAKQREQYLEREASFATDTEFISQCAWTLTQYAMAMNQKRELAVA